MNKYPEIQVITCNTVVVGTGAAGFNAAKRLAEYGQKDIAIVTEGIKRGTSRNTGSDKQTYYKLSLAGEDQDSVRKMAETLFQGQCMDGDIAMCEAALSAQSFFRLVELGVPFPCDRYGEYVGYRTDHDSTRRATSAGPYTSRLMTEALEKAVRKDNIKIYDRLQVIRILENDEKACGIICLRLDQLKDSRRRFVAFCCKNMILATGGPAGMYADSVYPYGHFGSTGVAFRAGIKGRNLTEWQFGLSSVKPRWNVSGTYMQVLPRFVSANMDGSEKREFLFDFFEQEDEILNKVFLKGYQWPFDVKKLAEGSSIIDVLVYMEKSKGRRVFLDFTDNPGKKEIDFSRLSKEAYDYLHAAGACFGTPIERLEKMNAPAVEFYLERGVDLHKDMLEIALCAQHNNGGLAVDCWWRTNVEGVFVAGEAAGTHGVYRPGGSALNAGQVGSMRAAQYIAANGAGEPDIKLFDEILPRQLEELERICAGCLCEEDTMRPLWDKTTRRMNLIGGIVRNTEEIAHTLEQLQEERTNFYSRVHIASYSDLARFFRLEETLLCQQVYLSAMLDYAKRGGKSRGSALYTEKDGVKPYKLLPSEFTYVEDDGSGKDFLQEIQYQNGHIVAQWRRVHPLPKEDVFFENVWRQYRENKNVY